MKNFKITKATKKHFETLAELLLYILSCMIVLQCNGIPHNYAHLSSALKGIDDKYKTKAARKRMKRCVDYLCDEAEKLHAHKTRKKWVHKNATSLHNTSLFRKPSEEALCYAKWRVWIPANAFCDVREASYHYSSVQEATKYYATLVRQKPEHVEWFNDDPKRKNRWDIKADNTDSGRFQYQFMDLFKKDMQRYLVYGKARGEAYLKRKFGNIAPLKPYLPIFRMMKKWAMTEKPKGRPKTVRSKKQAELLINRMTENMITSHMPEVSEKKVLPNGGGWQIRPVSTEELLKSYVFHPRFQILKDRLYPEIKGQQVQKVTLKIFKAIQQDVYEYFGIRWVTKDGVRKPILTYVLEAACDPPPDIHAPPKEERKIVRKYDEEISVKKAAMSLLQPTPTPATKPAEPKLEWYELDMEHWTEEQRMQFAATGNLLLDEFRQLKRAGVI